LIFYSFDWENCKILDIYIEPNYNKKFKNDSHKETKNRLNVANIDIELLDNCYNVLDGLETS